MNGTTKTKVVKIRPLEGYATLSDADIVHRAAAVVTGLTGNSNFTTLPVDLATLKAAVESLNALISEALDGSKKVITQKNKQRETVIKMLRLLSRYIEVNCDNDMAKFTSSGFMAASTVKAPPAPLPIPVIRSIDHGDLSGELVIQIEPIPKALSYDIRYGVVVNGTPPSSWITRTVTKTRPPAGIQGLTPATLYAFQVRAQGKLGFTDWTDSKTCICT